MSKQLIYLPCEKYKSRWTEYVSGKDGMFADCIKDTGVDLLTIAEHNEVLTIKSGQVLDTIHRADWGFYQTTTILHMIDGGTINSDSVIYIEDFWHPGMEMIPYACTLKGIKPKVYAFCHAQSVDPNDFTVKMLPWIRSFEVGWAQWLTGIFVAAKELKDMMTGQICTGDKIHVTGTVMHRDTLLRRFYKGYSAGSSGKMRKPGVLFTSRLDPEKCPDLFIKLAHIAKVAGKGWEFAVLSGRPVSDSFKRDAAAADVTVVDNISKEQYFECLSTNAVMFNCAKQDFVSYGLLDALAYGCLPLCPDYLTFPDVLGNDHSYLYQEGQMYDAYQRLVQLVEKAERSPVYYPGDPVPELYQKYGMKYEYSVARMIDVMFGQPSLESWIKRERCR